MSWLDVQHQSFAQRSIAKAMAQDRLAHAYIFHGPDGIGKRLFAIGLGEALLCSKPIVRATATDDPLQDEPIEAKAGCQACEDCQAVAASAHPDMHIIHRYLNREHPDPTVRKRKAFDLSVDVIRHFIINKVGLKPARGQCKVFIIQEADRMSIAAQNALLKTLEEPLGETLIMLLAKSTSKLLPTTVSRCQTVRFDALPTSFIIELLSSAVADLSPEVADLSPEKAKWYAEISCGSIGDAIEFARNDWYQKAQSLSSAMVNLETQHANVASLWTELAKSLVDSYRERDPDISDSEATRLGYKAVLRLTAHWFDTQMRSSTGAPSLGKEAYSQDSSRQRTLKDILLAPAAIERIVATERHLDLNANVQLCLETLLADLRNIVAGQTQAINRPA